MKHVKTLSTRTLKETMKKVVVENVRHHASQHVRHLVQLEIRAVKTNNSPYKEL